MKRMILSLIALAGLSNCSALYANVAAGVSGIILGYLSIINIKFGGISPGNTLKFLLLAGFIFVLGIFFDIFLLFARKQFSRKLIKTSLLINSIVFIIFFIEQNRSLLPNSFIQRFPLLFFNPLMWLIIPVLLIVTDVLLQYFIYRRYLFKVALYSIIFLDIICFLFIMATVMIFLAVAFSHDWPWLLFLL